MFAESKIWIKCNQIFGPYNQIIGWFKSDPNIGSFKGNPNVGSPFMSPSFGLLVQITD